MRSGIQEHVGRSWAYSICAGNPIAHILRVPVTATLKGNIKQPLTTCVYEDRTRLLQRANGAKKGDRDELALG